jgi:hypothetical protein
MQAFVFEIRRDQRIYKNLNIAELLAPELVQLLISLIVSPVELMAT